MIDKNIGSIKIGNVDGQIYSGLTKNEFINSNMYNEVFNQDNNTYTNYYLKPQNIGDCKFSIVVIFDPNNRIFMVKLRMLIDEKIPSWSDWTEENELDMKKRHDKWLEDNIGNPPYNYSWGKISSSYDPRSVSSVITFTYKKQRDFLHF